MRLPTKQQFRGFHFSHALVLVLCYCIAIQPNAALAARSAQLIKAGTREKTSANKTNRLKSPTLLDRLSLLVGINAPEPSPSPSPSPTITDAVVSRHKPVLGSGRIEGSLRVLAGESFSVSNSTQLLGDLYVPGTPAIQLGSGANHGGVVSDGGTATPSNYAVTLNNNAVLPGRIHTRSDAVALPTDFPTSVPASAGTRSVTVRSQSDIAAIGNWQTVRDLNVSGSRLTINLPPGNYGTLTVNGNSQINLSAGIYNFANTFNLDGSATLQSTGLVALNVAKDVTINSGALTLGSYTAPADVHLNVLGTVLKINGSSQVTGLVRAYNATVTLNGTAQVRGQVIADSFVLGGGKVIGAVWPAQSGSNMTIYGPRRFDRTSGQPNQYMEQFSLPSGVTSPYTLHIQNGSPDGSSRVSSATVKLNGIDILTPNDLNLNVAVVDRTVTLKPNNQLDVRLASDPGSYLIININGVMPVSDSTPPTLAITSPENDYETTDDEITVSGTASDTGTGATGVAHVYVNDVEATYNAGNNTWSIANVHLESGENQIVARAIDGAGNQTTASITVTHQAPENHKPVVGAGVDQTLTLPQTAALHGTATDDALPEGSTLTTTWTKVSGPGDVTFTDATALNTTASFSTDGTYVLRLTASDGALSESDEITITVQPQNQPPTVDAGPNQTIALPNTAALSGTVTDDGLPAGGALTIAWTKLSGPGDVTFEDPTKAETIATFSVAGEYKLRLFASDSDLSSSGDTTITVHPENQAPAVSAGAEQIIVLPAGAQLNGTVSDDGWPANSTVTSQWSMLSGPAPVQFDNPNVAITVARFTAPGPYVLRLTASDTALTNFADVSINVTLPPDTTAPTITITSPADNAPTQAETISVSGTVSDPGPYASGVAQVTVNDLPATLNPDGTWTINDVPLPTVGNNPIVARALDAAGNASQPQTINVDRRPPPDVTPPALAITSPTDGSSTQADSITVSGTVSDPGQYPSGVAQVTVNGVPAAIDGSNWSLAGVSLAVGPNPLAVHAVDHAGNATDQTITVGRQPPPDTTAPIVAITSPADNSPTQAETISVSGTVSDPGPYASGVASVTVNGVPATIDSGSGTWSASNIPLPTVGTNPISAIATDVAGNVSTTASINVNRQPPPDVTAPIVAITSPTNGSSTQAESITVTGTVTDPGQYPTGVAQVTVNGVPASLDVQAGTWSFAGFALDIGSTTIIARAVDHAGNASTQEITISRVPPPDTQAPTITITSPVNDFTSPDATITVTGTAIDEGPYASGVRQVLVNGQPATYDPATRQWTATGVALNEGPNTIHVIAEDNAPSPNSSQASINVNRHTPDTQAPTITITSPMSGDTYDATLSVSGTVVDDGLNATGVQSVKVNGVSANYDAGTGQWFVPSIPLVYGDNNIVVTATDRAPTPNQGQANVNVTRLRIPPPELVISNPLNGSVLAVTSITVAGTVTSLGTTPTVTINGQAATVSGGHFAGTVPLAEGANTITVVATDSLAQETQSSISVIRDLTSPAVSFANVPASVQPGGTYQIAVDATDNVGVADVEFNVNGQHVAVATTSPYQFTLAVPVTYAAGATLVLTAVARDLSNTTAVATAETRTGGPGGISGYAFDDTTGFVLPGVTAHLNNDVSVVTDPSGTFNLISLVPSGVVRLTKDGYTPVERLYSVAIGEGTALFDARLTPLDPQSNVIGANGGQASGDGGRLQANFPAGTFTSAKDMRVTAVSPQGLANLLPYGWSPIPGAVVDVRPAAAGADVSQEFPSPVLLTISQLSGLNSATPITLAYYDEASHRWMVKGVELHALVGGNGEATLSAALYCAGQHAFLIADSGSTAPPSAAVGQPLPASRSAESASLDSAQASAVASPRSAVYSASARSSISFFATALTQLPSGVSIEATFDETYNLLGGRDSVLVDRPAQDFVLYAYPAAVNQPNRLGAFFVAKPTRTDFNLTELFNANVHVEIRSGRQSQLGSLIGNTGGGVRASDGSLLTIPANALPGPQSVFFNDVSPQLANVNLPQGYEIVGAFDVDLGSTTLNASATISVPGVNGDLSRIVVARLVTVLGQRSPKVVGRTTTDADGNLTSTVATPPVPAGVSLSGIRTSGRYLFIRVPAPFGYVQGNVSDAATGNPLGMVKVSDDQTPFIDVTGADGKYVVVGSAGAGTVGQNQIGAVALTTDATGRVTASLNAQDAVANANITASAVPLQVESVTPVSNAQNMTATTPITVTFNKPIAASSVTGSSFSLSTASGNPVLGTITVMAGSRVVVFTPAATLAASTNYKITLTQSVRDIYSQRLAANFISTFTTAAAVAISNRLRPEQISISYPDAGGVSTISIPAGSVPAGATILVVNMTNGSTVTTVAGTAAITLSLPANVGDEIVLTIRQADGTEYTVTQSAYRRADGFVSVGANGGAVTSDDGTIVMQIPSGAINGQANIKLTAKGEDSITLARTGEMDPANVPFGAGVEITADGNFTLTKEVHLELAAPASAVEGKRVSFMKPSRVQIDGQDVDVWETVTSGTVIGGKFKTSSPPFFGSFFAAGVFSVYCFMPTFARVFFGEVREFKPGAENPLVPGVLVLVGDHSTGYFGRVVGRTNSQGTYALFEFSASATNDYPVRALDVATARTAVANAATSGTLEENFYQGLTGYQTLRANLLLPARDSIGGGDPPPTLDVYGIIGGPPDQDPLLTRGIAPVPATATIYAISNRPLPQITGTALVGGIETRQLTWQQTGPTTYVAPLEVSAEGSYHLRVTGTSQLGNPNSTTVVHYNFIGLRNPNTRPPLPEPPAVIHVSPGDGAENVDLATDIRVEFSEPVRNLVAGTTIYVQEAGKPEKIGGTILSGGVIVQPDTPSISSIIFKPTSSLQAGKKHFIHVTTEVRDDTNDALDQEYQGQTDTSKQPFSTSFETFGGLVITPQPIAETGTRVVVAGNYALTLTAEPSGGRSRVNIYDISNPISPTRSGSFYVPQRAFDIAATDSEADSLKIDGRVHTHLAAIVTVAPLNQEQWANVWFVNFDNVSEPEIVGVTSLFLPLDIPSTPLSVRLHQGRAYIGNVPFQGVNVVDVAQSIKLWNEGLAKGKNPFVDAVRPETGSMTAGFGHKAKVQTATLRRSEFLDGSGTAPSVDVITQTTPGLVASPHVYIANSLPKRLGVIDFLPLNDGVNISTQPTPGDADPRIKSAVVVDPVDSDPRFVRVTPEITDGQQVPLALLLSHSRLWIFNVADPRAPQQYPSKSLAELGLTGNARWFEIEGTLAYVVIDNDIAVIDFADPANPRLVSRLTGVGSHLAGLAVKDDFIYSISPGFGDGEGLNVSIARPASRLFIHGASADASTVCANPIIIDRVTHKMRQNAGFYFQVFGHKPPTSTQVVIRKGEAIIATVPGTVLSGSTELVTLGRAEWQTGDSIDRSATYTAEVLLDENAAGEYRSPREVIPFSFLLENYNETITQEIKGATAVADEKSPYAFVLGASANVTLTVNGSVVLNGPRGFGLHVEMLSFAGMAEGRYPFTLRAEVQGDETIAEQISGVLTIQRDLENARPPGHTVVSGVDIATGNVGLTQTDVADIPNRGLSLSFTRSYNTAGANKFGPLGYGWQHNFQVLLTFQRLANGNVTYRLRGGDGSGQSFKATGTTGALTMLAEKPYHSTLVRNADGSFDFFTKARIRYHFNGAYEVNSYNFYDQSYMGNLAFMEEPDGNRLTLVYDSLGRMTSVTDSSQRALRFEYEPAPNPFAGVIATTNGTRNEQSCVPRGQLNHLRQRFVRAQAGQAWRIKSISGPGGLAVVYTYDTDANLTGAKRNGTDDISVATADSFWQYAYKPSVQTSADLTHLIKSVINPNGHTTNYDYWFAQIGMPAKTVASPENVNVNFDYTLDGSNRIKQTSVTDARGNATTYVLSVDGYTTSMTAPRGAQTTFEFNDRGLKTRETDPLGTTTTFEYDPKGNLKKRTTTGSDGATSSSEALFDQTFSKPLSNRDANGNLTTFTLDGRGRITQVRMPNGNTKRFDYAGNGDLLRITDERGLQTQIQYDSYGNATRIQRATQTGQSVVSDRTFDARSRLLTVTDTLEPSVVRAYDALDRVKTETVTDPAGFQDTKNCTYTYTPMGQVLTAMMTGGGQSRTETSEYDNLERLTQVQESVSGVAGLLTRSFTYDGNSNVRAATDRRGVVTSYEYDALNYQTSARLSGSFGPDIVVQTLTPDLVGNPQTSVDQYGATTTFTYDGLHRLTKRTLPGNYTEEQVLDGNGNPVSIRDRNGRVTTIAYDSLNRPSQRRDPAGRVQTWTYTDATGTVVTNWSPQNITVTEQSDALGREMSRVTAFGAEKYTTTFSYSGRTRTIVDPRGISATEHLSASGEVGTHEIQAGLQTLRTERRYAAFGGLRTATDANGRTTTFVLDGLNRKTSANYPGGFTGAWTYDGEGLLLSETNKRGVTSSMTYDNQGRILTASAQGLGDTIPVLSISYDDANRRETRTDANNHSSVYVYDGLRRVVSMTNADNRSRTFEYDGVNLVKESSFKGQFTEYAYDALNRQTQIKDRLNQRTVIMHNDQNGYTKTVTNRRGNWSVEAYDPLERLIKVTHSGEALVSYEYDGNNNRTAMIDGRNNRTVYTYDELNRVKTINHANLQTETFAYDGVGNLTAYNDGRGPDVTMEYDAQNHLQKRTNGAGDVTQFRFDGEGFLLEKIEPKGTLYKTTHQYNALGSLKQVTDARGGIWELTYDGKQNLKSVKDARHNTTTYDYDPLDRLTAIHQPLSMSTTYGYDANGNRTSMRDPKGQELTLTYDALDRLTINSFQNLDGSQENKFEFGYDPEANLTSVENTRRQGSGVDTRSWALSYDSRDRLRTATDAFGKTVRYVYDAANNLTNFTDAAGKPTAYEYDANNRLQTATLTGLRQINYDWYADGLLQRVRYGGGLQRDYVYDNADRVSRITNTIGADGAQTQREEFDYTYDPNSNREIETSKLNNQPVRTAHYSYDQLNRLTQAAYDTPGATPNANTLTYSYDAAGNRESESGTTSDGTPVTRTYLHDELNRLTQLNDSGSVYRYEYDNNGNLAALKQSDGQLISSYEYDVWNQLRLVKSGVQQQEVARYDYDYARRRTNKSVGGGAAEHRFVYSGTDVVDEFDEFNRLLNRYDYGVDLARGEFAGEGERFYFTDGLGSTTSLSQITQSAISSATARYEYDAWGNIIRSAGGSFNQVGFTGQRRDGETGLMPLGNGERYYSPALGSFTQQDSYMGSALMTQSLNRYAYAHNNPTNFTDPSGHLIPLILLIGAAAIAITAVTTGTIRAHAEHNLEGDEKGWAKNDPRRSVGTAFSDATGATKVFQAVVGQDVYTGRDLSAGERVWQGTIGAVEVIGNATAVGGVVFKGGSLTVNLARGSDEAFQAVRGTMQSVRSGSQALQDARAVGNVLRHPIHSSKAAASVIKESYTSVGGVRGALKEAWTYTREEALPRLNPRNYSFERRGANVYTNFSGSSSSRVVQGANAADEFIGPTAQNPMRAGQLHEETQLAKLGVEKNTEVFRPTAEQIESSGFKAIVGEAKYTKGGQLKGTIFDSTTNGYLEIKGGGSVLKSTYQLRLQTFKAVSEGKPYTIQTTRPVDPNFREWLDFWGVKVVKP